MSRYVDDRDAALADAQRFAEDASPGDLAHLLQHAAAHMVRLRVTPEAAARLHEASQVLHKAESDRYARESRQYACFFCTRLRREASPDCPMAHDHFDEQLQRYAPLPYPLPQYAALCAFVKAHQGTPWFHAGFTDTENPQGLVIEYFAEPEGPGRPTAPGDTWEGWALRWQPTTYRGR